MKARIDAVIEEAISVGKIVGTVVIVAKDGETVYSRAAGYADREMGKPAETGTIFRLASVSKPLIAAAALALADKGRLALGDLSSGGNCHRVHFRIQKLSIHSNLLRCLEPRERCKRCDARGLLSIRQSSLSKSDLPPRFTLAACRLEGAVFHGRPILSVGPEPRQTRQCG